VEDEMPEWILILDEDLHTRLTIAHVFAQRGFVVIETAKVADAFECAERLDLAVVFLAIDAPEGGGIAVLNLLRESHPDLAVAVVADHFTEQLAQEARRHGARCCLERPISGAVIEELATELCSAQPRGGVAASVRGPRQLACV
jgi:two-component system, NarL family, response regulator DevR